MKTWLMDKMDMEVQRKSIHSENTELHQAIYDGEVEKALTLIPEIENLNMPEPTFLLTPLHLAARSGHLSVVEALLNAGASPDSRDDGGMSPLHKAAENGYVEIVKLLISKKVSIDPGAFGRGMYTPLMMAVMSDHVKIVELLLKAGADPYRKDKRDRNCLKHAKKKPIMKDLFQQFGYKFYEEDVEEYNTKFRLNFSNVEELPFPPEDLPYDLAFFMAEIKSGRCWAFNEELTNVRSSPGQTFLIPLFLLSLHKKAVPNFWHKLPWDGTTYTYEPWNKDHNALSAYDERCLWFFQEMARRIGPEEMKKALEEMNYGNCEISNNISTFWFDGSLKISPLEQVKFISSIKAGNFPGICDNATFLFNSDNFDMPIGFSLKPGNVSSPAVGWTVGVGDINFNSYVYCTKITGSSTCKAPEALRITQELLWKNIPL